MFPPCRWMSPAALDLAEMLLTFDPLKRVTAQAAMETPYFTEEEPLAELPTGYACSLFLASLGDSSTAGYRPSKVNGTSWNQRPNAKGNARKKIPPHRKKRPPFSHYSLSLLSLLCPQPSIALLYLTCVLIYSPFLGVVFQCTALLPQKLL